MHAKGLTPILNVSDIGQSFVWFEKLGWKKLWDWGDPPGPDWGWRIEIEPGAHALRIAHTNIFPDGKEELAAGGVYTRA